MGTGTNRFPCSADHKQAGLATIPVDAQSVVVMPYIQINIYILYSVLPIEDSGKERRTGIRSMGFPGKGSICFSSY